MADPGEEDVPDNLRLLLETVPIERSPRHQVVAVAAERVAHQRQIETAAFLRLPDVGHFVDEESLAAERLVGMVAQKA